MANNEMDAVPTQMEIEASFNVATGKPIGYIKHKENDILALCETIKSLPSVDARMAAVAKTQIELGFLALQRALKRV